jgi:hypothetical protein
MGLLAFGVLVVGGIRYLTSAGDPGTIKDAKSQMKSALLGILLLLFSYLILITINPQLVKFSVTEPEEIATESVTIIGNDSIDVLARIKSIARGMDDTAEVLANLGMELYNTVNDSCKCGNGTAECDCVYDCMPIRCYGDPCGDEREHIEELQRKIVENKDKINYYRMLLESEMEDLLPELQRLSDKNADKILDEDGNGILRNLCDIIKKEYTTEEESTGIVIDAEKLASLPDQCRNSESCTPKCDTENAHCLVDCSFDEENGDEEGCPSDGCEGDNPCPTEEIKSLAEEISKKQKQIDDYYQQLEDLLTIKLEI